MAIDPTINKSRDLTVPMRGVCMLKMGANGKGLNNARHRFESDKNMISAVTVSIRRIKPKGGVDMCRTHAIFLEFRKCDVAK